MSDQTTLMAMAALTVCLAVIALRVGWMLLKLLQWKYQDAKAERNTPSPQPRQYQRRVSTWQ